MDELTLVMNVVQELCPWCQMYHIWSNLYITAGVLCTPDVVMIFWFSRGVGITSTSIILLEVLDAQNTGKFTWTLHRLRFKSTKRK